MGRKYYIDNSIDQQKWEAIVAEALSMADAVEFNYLYKKKKVPPEVAILKDEVIADGVRKDKVYPAGEFIRYRLGKEVIDFVRSKELSHWQNFPLEDISFLKDGIEFLATVSHEGYVVLLMTEEEKETRNSQGFHFDFEWK